MVMITKKIEIEIIDNGTDASVACICALQQVMDYFCNGKIPERSLSPMGYDKRSVIAWFTQRYVADTPSFKIERNS